MWFLIHGRVEFIHTAARKKFCLRLFQPCRQHLQEQTEWRLRLMVCSLSHCNHKPMRVRGLGTSAQLVPPPWDDARWYLRRVGNQPNLPFRPL